MEESLEGKLKHTPPRSKSTVFGGVCSVTTSPRHPYVTPDKPIMTGQSGELSTESPVPVLP